MKALLILPALLFALGTSAQTPCCTIIDVSAEAGTFTIRHHETGRISAFKPNALESAELKVGDSVDVQFDNRKVIAVKGVNRTYDLLDALPGDSCCMVLQVDSLAANEPCKVTAKNGVTGENIYFIVPRELAAKLVQGYLVFMQPTHGYALLTFAGRDSTEKSLFGFPLLQESK